MKVKITHDGSFDCKGTTIVNAATGELIERVSRIDLTFDATEGVSAIVYISSVELDMTVDANFERENILFYDPDDNDSLDKAIEVLREQRAARDRT